MKAASSQVIKLKREVYDKLRKVVGLVMAHGWQHVGAKRQERSTMSTVVDEALDQLMRRNGRTK